MFLSTNQMHETKEVLLSTPTDRTMETSVVTQMLERLEAPLAALLASSVKDSKAVRDLERALMEAKMTVMKTEMDALKEDNKNLRTLNGCLQATQRWRTRPLWGCEAEVRPSSLAALLARGQQADLDAAAAEARPTDATCALLAALRAMRPAEATAEAAEPAAAWVPPSEPAASDGDEDLYS